MRTRYLRFSFLLIIVLLSLASPPHVTASLDNRTYLVTIESLSYRDGVVYRSKTSSEVQVSLIEKNTTHVTYQVQDPSKYSLGYPVNVTETISIHNYQFTGHFNENGRLKWLEYKIGYYRNPIEANYPLTSNEFSVLSKTTWELFRPNVTPSLVTFSLSYKEYRENQVLTVLAEFNTINDDQGLIISSEIYLNKKDEAGKIVEEYFYRIEEPTYYHRLTMLPLFAYYGDLLLVLSILLVLFLIASYLKRDSIKFSLKKWFSRNKTEKTE